MIDSIFFDMGGTLEDVRFSPETEQRVTLKTMEMLRNAGLTIKMEPDEFWKILWAGVSRYKKYSQEKMIEEKPEIIWPEFYLKEFGFDSEIIKPMAEDLAGMWEVTYYDRCMRPHVTEMLQALKDYGYKLGVISNNASLNAVFDVLERFDLRQYFDTVTVSSCTGYRKPNPGIFHIAMRESGCKPENCAYVGDTVSRDLIGAQRAGFGKTILIKSFLTGASDSAKNTGGAGEADHIITDIYEVAEIMKR